MENKKILLVIGGGALILVLAGVLFFVWHRSGNKQEKVVVSDQADNVIPVTQEDRDLFGDKQQQEQRARDRQQVDGDQDGIASADEKTRGTDPTKPDTDGDGLSDGDEISLLMTDPLKLTSRVELQAALKLLPDSPYKAQWTAEHTFLLVDAKAPVIPTVSTSVSSTDSLSTTNETSDQDGDGLVDAQERSLKTNAQIADTDGDGISDGEEVNEYKTDPTKKDSDGDGYEDAVEIKGGYNPRGAGSCLNPGCLP